MEAQASPNDDSGRSGVRFVIHLVYFYHSTEELFDSRVTLFTSPLPHGVRYLAISKNPAFFCCCCFRRQVDVWSVGVIITLFESQIILAEHKCCTNWGDCKSNKSNQIKCWFLWIGENRSSRRKTSRSRVENQQTQPTYDAGFGNRTRDTLVEGERSHHCANLAPLLIHGSPFACSMHH